MLPVDLVHFDGLQKNGRTYLSWSTASEQNSKAFYVERRSPLSPWETIGEVEAAGNSSKNHSYDFIDPSPAEVRTLYRLRQVDLDGAAHFSNVITVESSFGSKLDFKIFPNPASGEARLYTGSPLVASSRVQVLDLSGKRLLDFEVEEGTREVILNLGDLRPGLHLVRIQSQGTVEHRKLVVK
ncbi:MAG: T9SS type A sorting domain-containing protein [Bacteroidia bacterium]